MVKVLESAHTLWWMSKGFPLQRAIFSLNIHGNNGRVTVSKLGTLSD